MASGDLINPCSAKVFRDDNEREAHLNASGKIRKGGVIKCYEKTTVLQENLIQTYYSLESHQGRSVQQRRG